MSSELNNAFHFSRQARAERLVSAGRVVLLGVALAADVVEPGGAPGWDLPTAVLGSGLIFAIVVLALAWRPDAPPVRVAVWLHAIDLILFSAVIATHGSASPFYLYFLFLLLAAALRWHASGVVWTAVVAGAAFVAIGVYDATLERDASFNLAQFTMRLGHFIITALLLAYVARHQHRLHIDLIRLATWPDAGTDDEPAFLAETLRHVGRVLGVPRVVLIHQDAEEPWVEIADWSPGGCQFAREPRWSSEALIAGELHNASFFCGDASAPVSHVVYRSRVGLQRWRGEPVASLLRVRLQAQRLLSCPLTSSVVSGRIIFVNGPRPSADDLLFAEVVTGMLSVRLDQHRLARRLRERAVSEERQRVSRDLHDGLLQSLTAWTLQIGDIARRVQSTDPVVGHRLQHMRRQMTADQRELRNVMGRLQAEGAAEPVDFSLIGRLHDLRDRFMEEWGLTVQVDFSGLHALVPAALRAEVCGLVHEALANAARHAQTSLVRVEVAATDDDVFLSVQDRGRGFPFKGRYDLARLRAERLGPTSLVDRVADLGGELVLESSEAGSRLDIIIPCHAVRAGPATNAS